MGWALQQYLVTPDETLYRVANTVFVRMLDDPAAHRVPAFAGQRIRSAEVVVLLADRQPVAVVRTSLSVITFDATGCADASRLPRQQHARAENALAPVLEARARGGKVVQAASQFIAQGGEWTPSQAMQRMIEAAALGRRPCRRLLTTHAP